MSDAKPNKFLRFLTLNLHSTIDIVLITIGLLNVFMGVSGSFVADWSNSLAIAWSISFFFKAIAGAAMISATICSVAKTSRIISAISVGYCVCHFVYLNLINASMIMSVIVLLAMVVEAFLSKRVDLQTASLKDRLERNALKVYRLVAIPIAPLVFLLAVVLVCMFRPAIENINLA